jgi:hypothetical protein
MKRRDFLIGATAIIGLIALDPPHPALAATVVKTIGSGARDFATLALWASGVPLPANFVTDGNSYEADMYNDSNSFTGSTTYFTLTGHTTDATHFPTITAGAGQAWCDSASVKNNSTPLKYNQANGVGITTSGNYGAGRALIISDEFAVVSRLQLNCSNASAHSFQNTLEASGPFAGTFTGLDLLIDGHGIACLHIEQFPNSLIANCWLIQREAAGNACVLSDGVLMSYIDFVSPSDVTNSSAAIKTTSGANTAGNVNVFGFNSLSDTGSGGSITFTSSITDIAGTTGITGGKSFSAQYINTTTASGDFFHKAGAPSEGAGTFLNNGFDTPDAFGNARPQNGTYDTGAMTAIRVSLRKHGLTSTGVG